MKPVQMMEQTGLDDPFLAAAADNGGFSAGIDGADEASAQTTAASSVQPPDESGTLAEPELLLETEEQHTLSETEQAELLGTSLWVKNLALLNFQETGKKTESSVSSSDRQRRDAINRLNMSNKELAKSKSKHYEYADASASDWRWMHRGADKLLAVNTKHRTSPEVFLQETKYRDKKYRILRANAAIVLGRDGNTAVKKYLLQLVATETMPMTLRCAACETLGRLANVTENDLLPLLKNDSPNEADAAVSNDTGSAPPVEIWEEILVALAEKVNPWDNAVFSEPFTATPFDIRFAAAKIWRMKSVSRNDRIGEQLPDDFIEFAKREGNPQIRVEIIKTLAAWNEPKLYSLIASDLNRSADVRNAAMTALADCKCREAVTVIKNKLHDPVGTNRAAAVAALRKLGCIDDVLKQSKDEDPRVRCETAKALGEKCNPQTVIMAKKFIEDRYDYVQAATVNAVAGWNIEESGHILLAAAKSPYPKVRQRAVSLLGNHGLQYEPFDPLDNPKNQAENYQELTQIVQDTVGFSDDVRTTRGRFSSDTNDTDKSAASPSVPLAPLLAQLETGTVLEQRKAAAELAKQCSVEPPQNSDTKRLLDIIMRQSDPAILTTLLSTLKEADPVLVSPAARNMLQAEQPEIRRLSCEILKRFGTEDDLPLLGTALRDPSKAVVRGALQAVDSLLPKTQSASAKADITAALKKMLYQADPMLQTDIAATLHRSGSAEGTEALRRLAVSKDSRTKCYVAKTLAGLQDETFLPVLLGYLDDGNGSVRNEALQALPVLTGRDAANDAGSHSAEVSQTQRQIALWKNWAASRKPQ
jgi:HEAT repeat protein